MNIYQTIDPIGKTKELVEKKLFPKTKIHKRNKNLFLYHEKKMYCTKPKEWTLGMLKDAILSMLEVDIILQKYGFTIKDFHFDNIAFSQGKPYFIDFGSIVDKNTHSSLYLDEFIYNILPLLQVQKSYYISLRYLSDEKRERFFGITSNQHIPLIIHIYKFLVKLNNFIYKKTSFTYFKTKNNPHIYKKYIENIYTPVIHSKWENYHQDFLNNFDNPDQRFLSLIQEIKQFSPETILDIAGNSGYFALLCSKKIPMIKNIYCCDCDYNAINNLYKFIKSHNEITNVTPVLMNIAFPVRTSGDSHYIRFKSDIVCALAVTHHLFLSQFINPDYFFSEIRKYTKKVAIIEFMPLGLYNGISSLPVPIWYTKSWFERHFLKYFKKIKEINLEKNRIAFLGIPILGK